MPVKNAIQQAVQKQVAVNNATQPKKSSAQQQKAPNKGLLNPGKPKKQPIPPTTLTKQKSMKPLRPASVQPHGNFFARMFCSCCGSKPKATQDMETNDNEANDPAGGNGQAGTSQTANGGIAQKTDENPTANITINVTGKNVVVQQKDNDPDSQVASQFNDPVRSIRISPADIPRVQSRMNG